MLQNLVLETYLRGESVYCTGESADKVFIVKTGTLQARHKIQEYNITVNTIIDKQIIGFEEVIDARGREKDLVVTSEKAQLYSIQGTFFIALLQKNIMLSTMFIKGK